MHSEHRGCEHSGPSQDRPRLLLEPRNQTPRPCSAEPRSRPHIATASAAWLIAFFLELRQLTARDVFCRVMQSAAQLVYRVQPAQPCTASDAASALRKLLYAPPLLENRCARAQDLAAPRVYCLLKSMRRPPQRQLSRALLQLFCRHPRRSAPLVFHEQVPGLGRSRSSGTGPETLLEFCAPGPELGVC